MSQEGIKAGQEGCNPCGLICGPENLSMSRDIDEDVSYPERTHIRLQTDQPVVPVPVYQELQKRDIYVEVPQVEVQDSIIPRVYNQSAVHDVPHMDVSYSDREFQIDSETPIQKDVDVSIPMGYAPQFVPKWDVREVPRPVPKYEGEQQVIEVEVPQIEYKDRYVEKEVVVDVQEKIIPKVTEVVKEVEVMQYEWKQKFQDVPVYKYVPKFDVELDCPPPLIVPYAETRYVNEEPQISRPYFLGCTNCCDPGPNEARIIPNDRLMMNSGGIDTRTIHGAHQGQAFAFNSSIPGTQLVNGSGTSPLISGDLNEMFQKQFSQEYVVKGQLSGDSSGSPMLHQLTPGPVFPNPSLQSRSGALSDEHQRGRKNRERSFWNWLWNCDGCNTDTNQKLKDQMDVASMGYPEGMPTDFAVSFNQESAPQSARHVIDGSLEKSPDSVGELEPSVVYRGAVSKPPEYGGELDPISFKLHAIEIHQFVPLPHSEIPDFVKALPDGILSTDISGLDKFFGQVPSGWADPDVTGTPAPMISDILAGNTQNAVLSNQLVCQLSSQFSKQGYVPGGTQEFTHRSESKPIAN